MKRTLIVFDGDNVQAGVGNYRGRARAINVLRLRSIERLITSLLPPETEVRSAVFITHFMAPDTVPWKKLNPKTRIWMYNFPLVNGFGYPDVMVKRDIDTHLTEFDHLILVTSDKDFFVYAEDLAREKGKHVTIFALRRCTNNRLFQSLTGIEARYLDTLVNVAAEPPSWQQIKSQYKPPLRW